MAPTASRTVVTGKGVTVAITDVGALPTMAKDAKKWSKLHGVQPFAKGQYKEYVEPGAPYNPGWAGEESLDVEAVHGMAPDAKVAYFGIASDFTWAFDQIVDQHLADVVTDSWTTSPGEAAAYEQDFQMGATEGIGFYFSSGDSGRSDNAYPSSDPWSTSIGGSSIGITKSNGYSWETSWESDYSALSKDGKSWTPAPPGTFQSGSGGGTSTTYKQPSWQKGVVPKQFSEQYGKTPMRTTPDIGAEADPTTGFLQGYSSQVDGKFVYGEDRIGGTSLSSPVARRHDRRRDPGRRRHGDRLRRPGDLPALRVEELPRRHRQAVRCQDPRGIGPYGRGRAQAARPWWRSPVSATPPTASSRRSRAGTTRRG